MYPQQQSHSIQRARIYRCSATPPYWSARVRSTMIVLFAFADESRRLDHSHIETTCPLRFRSKLMSNSNVLCASDEWDSGLSRVRMNDTNSAILSNASMSDLNAWFYESSIIEKVTSVRTWYPITLLHPLFHLHPHQTVYSSLDLAFPVNAQ